MIQMKTSRADSEIEDQELNTKWPIPYQPNMMLQKHYSKYASYI